MALKIRLRRMGRKNAPTYRIVVAESSMPRDGRFVTSLGHYNPRTEPMTLVVDREQALQWIAKGAVPTDTAGSLLKRAGIFKPEAEQPSVAAAAVESVKKTVGKAAGKVAGAVKEVAEEIRERVGGEEEAAPAEEAPAAEEPKAEAEEEPKGEGDEEPKAEGAEEPKAEGREG